MNLRFRFTSFATALVGIGGSFGASIERVYIACPEAGIRVAEFDSETGALSKPREAVSLSGAGFLATHPTKPFLYATCKIGERDGVAAFQVAQDGSLRLINQSQSEGKETCHLSLDHTGGVAFAASYSSGSVSSFRVSDDGSLSEVVSVIQHEGSSIRPQQQEPRAHFILADPSNSFVYAADLGADEVVRYRFDKENAELEKAGADKLKPGAGPRHFKFSKKGDRIYVVNEFDLSVTTFDRNSESGALVDAVTTSAIPDELVREGMTCAEIRIHPDGRFLVTSQRDSETIEKDEIGRNSLSVLAVEEGGGLRRVATVPAGVRFPRNFNFDPSGKWLLVGGQFSNDIQVFSFDSASGKLEPKGEPVACPSPICFEFARRE